MIKYVTLFIGMSVGILIGFSVYHYFFMDKLSCCGVYRMKKVSKTFKIMILIMFILVVTVTMVYGAC